MVRIVQNCVSGLKVNGTKYRLFLLFSDIKNPINIHNIQVSVLVNNDVYLLFGYIKFDE